MSKRLLDRIEVVFEDLDLAIVEKASGIISYPAGDFREDSVIQLIRRYWKATGKTNQNLYLLHRLDKDTSGLMVFAKTSLARMSLQTQFEEHSVLRQYLAVTRGVPGMRQGEIRAPLSRDKSGRRGVTQYGRFALTKYDVVSEKRHRGIALIRCRLHTGRTHQVRIHLAHAGAPVMGDRVYGKDGGNRLALHAETLGFLHPRSGLPIVFRSSLPEELRRLLR